MSNKASDAIFNELHGALATDLLTRIKNGTATAADLSVARQFLKDNAVSAEPVKASPLGNLAAELPVFEDSAFPTH